MSEETVKAYHRLGELDNGLDAINRAVVGLHEQLRTYVAQRKELQAEKRELLKVVKVVRTRKKPEPKKRGRPAGSKNKGKATIPTASESPAKPQADSEPTTIAPEYMQPTEE